MKERGRGRKGEIKEKTEKDREKDTKREKRQRDRNRESVRAIEKEGGKKGGTYMYMYIYYTSGFLLPRLLPHGNSFIASGRVQWTGSLITASSDGNRAPTILPLLERLFSQEDGDFTSSVLPSVEVAESSLLDSEEEEEETEDRTSKNWREIKKEMKNVYVHTVQLNSKYIIFVCTCILNYFTFSQVSNTLRSLHVHINEALHS